MIKLLTPEELSKILRIPKRSIYRFAQEGHIPGGFRVGRHWRFRQDLIEDWINGQGSKKQFNPSIKGNCLTPSLRGDRRRRSTKQSTSLEIASPILGTPARNDAK